LRRVKTVLILLIGVSLLHGPFQAWAVIASPGAEMDTYFYATFLGGGSGDIVRSIAVDSTGNMVVVGSTYSEDFPVLNAYQPTYAGGFTDDIHVVGGEGFVAKLSQEGGLHGLPRRGRLRAPNVWRRRDGWLRGSPRLRRGTAQVDLLRRLGGR